MRRLSLQHGDEQLSELLKLRGKSSEWYVCAYMEYVMSWQLYGTVLFPVEVVMSARCDA